MSRLDDIINDMRDGYDDAINELRNGNDQAANQILVGLGLSVAEREKWFDIAMDMLEPAIKFGDSYKPDYRALMDQYNKLIFDPDAIYGTEAWKSYKGQIEDAVTNSAAAKGGLGSGNFSTDLSDYVGSGAINFRNSELSNIAQGADMAWRPIAVGENARLQGAQNAMATGAGIAGDYMGGYGMMGNLYGNQANAIANMYAQRASDMSNINLAEMLGRRNERSGLLNSLINLGGYALGNFMPTFKGRTPKSKNTVFGL